MSKNIKVVNTVITADEDYIKKRLDKYDLFTQIKYVDFTHIMITNILDYIFPVSIRQPNVTPIVIVGEKPFEYYNSDGLNICPTGQKIECYSFYYKYNTKRELISITNKERLQEIIIDINATFSLIDIIKNTSNYEYRDFDINLYDKNFKSYQKVFKINNVDQIIKDVSAILGSKTIDNYELSNFSNEILELEYYHKHKNTKKITEITNKLKEIKNKNIQEIGTNYRTDGGVFENLILNNYNNAQTKLDEYIIHKKKESTPSDVIISTKEKKENTKEMQRKKYTIPKLIYECINNIYTYSEMEKLLHVFVKKDTSGFYKIENELICPHYKEYIEQFLKTNKDTKHDIDPGGAILFIVNKWCSKINAHIINKNNTFNQDSNDNVDEMNINTNDMSNKYMDLDEADKDYYCTFCSEYVYSEFSESVSFQSHQESSDSENTMNIYYLDILRNVYNCLSYCEIKKEFIDEITPIFKTLNVNEIVLSTINVQNIKYFTLQQNNPNDDFIQFIIKLLSYSIVSAICELYPKSCKIKEFIEHNKFKASNKDLMNYFVIKFINASKTDITDFVIDKAFIITTFIKFTEFSKMVLLKQDLTIKDEDIENIILFNDLLFEFIFSVNLSYDKDTDFDDVKEKYILLTKTKIKTNELNKENVELLEKIFPKKYLELIHLYDVLDGKNKISKVDREDAALSGGNNLICNNSILEIQSFLNTILFSVDQSIQTKNEVVNNPQSKVDKDAKYTVLNKYFNIIEYTKHSDKLLDIQNIKLFKINSFYESSVSHCPVNYYHILDSNEICKKCGYNITATPETKEKYYIKYYSNHIDIDIIKSTPEPTTFKIVDVEAENQSIFGKEVGLLYKYTNKKYWVNLGLSYLMIFNKFEKYTERIDNTYTRLSRLIEYYTVIFQIINKVDQNTFQIKANIKGLNIGVYQIANYTLPLNNLCNYYLEKIFIFLIDVKSASTELFDFITLLIDQYEKKYAVPEIDVSKQLFNNSSNDDFDEQTEEDFASAYKVVKDIYSMDGVDTEGLNNIDDD